MFLFILLITINSTIPVNPTSDPVTIGFQVSPGSGEIGKTIITVTITNWNITQWLGNWPGVTIQDTKKDFQEFSLSPVWDTATNSHVNWTEIGENTWTRTYTLYPLAREGANIISLKYYSLILNEKSFTVVREDSTDPSPTKKEIFGYVEDGHAHRLEEVMVTLRWDKDSNGEYEIQKTTYTNNKGEYRFDDPQISIPMDGSGFLEVKLTDKNNIIEVIQHGYQNEQAYLMRFPFYVSFEDQLEQNLFFQNTENADSVATTYYYTYIALKFYRDILGVTFGPEGDCDLTPLKVYTFHEKGTYYSFPYSYNYPPDQIEQNPIKNQINPGGIFISKGHSNWNNPNAPKNREWHEFSHYVMDEINGRKYEMVYKPQIVPLVELWNDLNLDDKKDPNEPFSDSNDINNNGVWDQDLNHGGPNKHSYYNNLRTDDSWVEGFAEFMGCVIGDYAKKQGYTYNKVKLEPYMYPIANQKECVPKNLEVGYRDYLAEELTVASILWDLYDSPFEDDIQIDLDDLWSIIKIPHTFPKYWTINYNNIPAKINYLIDFDFQETSTETRPISCIKDLYDVLINNFPNKKDSINQIFHKAYIVIWDEYYFDKNNNGKFDKGIDEWRSEFDRDNNGEYTPILPKDLYIYGITDSSRPYRRNTPPTPGSTLLLDVNELPSNLTITIEYAPPYQDLSYTETFPITESPYEIYFTINPTQDDQPPHTAYLNIQKPGYTTSETLTITSDFYWENIETSEEHLLYHEFAIEPDPNSNIPPNSQEPDSNGDSLPAIDDLRNLIENLFSESPSIIVIGLIGLVILLGVGFYLKSKKNEQQCNTRQDIGS